MSEEWLGLLGPVASMTEEQARGLIGPLADMNEADAREMLAPLSGMSQEQAQELMRGPQRATAAEPETEPEEETPRQRLERLRRETAPERARLNTRQEKPSTGATVGITGLRRFVDNLLAFPGVVGDSLAAHAALPQAAIQSGVAAVRGQPANFRERFTEQHQAERGRFPASMLIDAETDSAELMADASARDLTARDPGDRFHSGAPRRSGSVSDRRETALADQRAADRELAEQAPGATLAGEILGDVATVLSGRAPVVRARAPQLAANRARLTQEAAEQAPMKLSPKIERELNDIVSRSIAPMFTSGGRQLARAGVKAGETGVEGAVLALLNEGDPVATGAFAAGGQAAGSAMLFLGGKAVRHPLHFIAAAFAASEMFKAATPGEQDFFASKDFAVQKAIASFALGTAAAMMGAGRFRSPQAERFPALFDAMTATPRAAAISGLLQDFVNGSDGGDNLPLRVAEQVHQHPERFSRDQVNALSRAMTNGRFAQEVNRLMEDSPSFREAVDGANQ